MEKTATADLAPATEETVPPEGAGIDDAAHTADDPDAHVENDPGTSRPAGLLSRVAATVAAALGLLSHSGTWLGTVLSERQRLLGQINHSSGSPADQIEHIYGAAWHMTALVNGAFALAALMIASLVLITTRQPALWTRTLAWSGIVLSVLGLLIATGMWLDLFAALPSVPATSPSPSAG